MYVAYCNCLKYFVPCVNVMSSIISTKMILTAVLLVAAVGMISASALHSPTLDFAKKSTTKNSINVGNGNGDDRSVKTGDDRSVKTGDNAVN